MRRPVTLGFVIWIVIGLVVAANKGFLGHLDSVSGFLSAVLAVLVWPLVALSGASLLASNSVTVVQGQELLPRHRGLASGLTLGLGFGLSPKPGD